MNPEAQVKLDEILQKEAAALTDADVAFLKARKDYLTNDQRAAYNEVLGEESKPPKIKGLSYQELQAKAKELGLKIRVGIKKADLENMVAVAGAEVGTPGE